MTPSRFQFGPPAPRDLGIIERATRLTIEICRDKDSDLHGEWTVSGGFGLFGRDKEADPDDFGRQQAEALRFIRGLLDRFEKKDGRDDGPEGVPHG